MSEQTQAAKSQTVATAEPIPVADVASELVTSTDRQDRVLSDCTKPNTALDLVNVRFATDPDLRDSDTLTVRRKLVLAEALKLVAESLDPRSDQRLTLATLRQAKAGLTESVNLGIGQMLERLRPREELAHQLILWKANSSHTRERTLPQKQTSLFIGPNQLASKAFQKVVDLELQRTNGHIADGEYRSFLFLPFSDLKGESMGALPYMKMAEHHHMLVVGSLPVANSLDSANQMFKQWKFNITDVDADDFELLSHASVVLNHLVIRDPHQKYFETQPLTVGLHYAYAGQMTRYFMRKKAGHWYVPVVHPRIKSRDMRTVNVVDRIEHWHACVENGFNFAYTTTSSQDAIEPGVRIIGCTTVFPEEAIDMERMGSQAIPLTQAQARAVKNRICDQLKGSLEKLTGGQVDEADVRTLVRRYLNGLFLQQQIYGFTIHSVKKSDTGVFSIKLEIRWSAAAEEFQIHFSGRPNDDGKQQEQSD